MAKIKSLKGAIQATSATINGDGIGNNVTMSLPEVTPGTTEITGAGGTVEVPVASKIEAMEASISVQGVSKDVLKHIKPEPCSVVANLVQQSFDLEGSSKPEHIKAVMRAIPKNIPGIEASYGENTELEIPLSVLSYKLFIDGELVTHVDPILGIYKVNGTDYAAEVKAMI